MNDPCPGREPVLAEHCWHKDKTCDTQACCWCGVLGVTHPEDWEHGPFAATSEEIAALEELAKDSKASTK